MNVRFWHKADIRCMRFISDSYPFNKAIFKLTSCGLSRLVWGKGELVYDPVRTRGSRVRISPGAPIECFSIDQVV